MPYLSFLRSNAALVVALSLLTSVRAHGYVETFVYGGTNYTGYLPYNDPYMNPVPDRIERVIPGNGPIEDVTSEDIRCNTGGTAPAALYATAEAGSDVEMHWTTWPTSHAGPVITYLAQVPDGSNITSWEPGTDAVWFKVDEAGYEDGKWAATDIMVTEQNNVWYWTIPSGLQAGQYLVRHEIIALHSAGTYPGAQFYPGCSQIEVTGSGSAFPDSSYLVSFPGAYVGTDPGITFNMYTTFDNYTIPGPALWTGGSGAASSTVASGASSTAASGASSATASGATSATVSGTTSAAGSVSASSTSVPASSLASTSVSSHAAVATSASSSSAIASTASVPSSTVAQVTATSTTKTSSAAQSTSTGTNDANQCMNTYNSCIAASQPNPDWDGCGSTKDSCLANAKYQRRRSFSTARIPNKREF
ncbi:hypothetical protein ARMSODRAFT_987678 [Armillaria solidipes]|uniref:lytic cellulose monooxygenase (C4-dehydrogenating) n=1 Tax=Armillaria solidipes TaxID=1076256 RepID=A0A2H3BYP7_9AGAR|nr:hypothetical protein ARMSODRAFT_987678 [Armillaria solidipes]